MKKSNQGARCVSTYRGERGPKHETSNAQHHRTATHYQQSVENRHNPSLDDKIQALLDQNKILNEKLRVKLSTEVSPRLQTNISQDIDLSWSTPKLVDEDDCIQDFSINAGSYIKKESITDETMRSIFQRMAYLEQIIEDQDRTIGELKQIYKESILNGDVIAENKKLVRENMELKRQISDQGQRLLRFQEFQQTIEPQFRELATENERLTHYLAQHHPPNLTQDCSQRIIALEREVRSLRQLLPSENTPPPDDYQQYSNCPMTPTKQLEFYQSEKSSELLRRLNCLSQNLINCTKK